MLNASERVQQKKKSISKCKHDECLAEAKFNYNGQRYRLYYSQHKLSVMVNIIARKKRGQQIHSEPTTGCPSLPDKGQGRERRGADKALGPCSLEQDVQGGQLNGAKGRPLNPLTLPKHDDALSLDTVRPRYVPHPDEAQGRRGERGADVW